MTTLVDDVELSRERLSANPLPQRVNSCQGSAGASSRGAADVIRRPGIVALQSIGYGEILPPGGWLRSFTMKCSPDRFAVSKFSRERNLINLEPSYQREGGVWSVPKQQLFIDSLLNQYDIPKIYLHKVDRDATGLDYAVIDGKQRISTIFAFLDGDLDLADDFQYGGPPCEDPPTKEVRFSGLSTSAQEIFKECTLDVVIVETSDEDEIEELFSRLNNGEKLNAAESRNAIGGKVTELIRELCSESFFSSKLGFSNRRYAHYEVACKLLYLEHCAAQSSSRDWFVDLKKKHLDAFVKDHRVMSDRDAVKLMRAVKANLRRISPVFDDKDIELSKQSYPQLMYLFLKTIMESYGAIDLAARLRRFLVDFRQERFYNLQKNEDERDAELAEFGRLMQQGTNDSGSMKERVNILTKRFLKANEDVTLLDPRRAFSLEERWVLWQRSGKECEICHVGLATLDELDGDHIVWHTVGGPTTLENARALCIPCNRGHVESQRD